MIYGAFYSRNVMKSDKDLDSTRNFSPNETMFVIVFAVECFLLNACKSPLGKQNKLINDFLLLKGIS